LLLTALALKFIGRYFIAISIISIFIVLVEILFNNIPVLKQLQFSILDYRLTDHFYSSYWKSETKRNDIVLVNIGLLGRDSIGLVIDKINQLDPSIIGMTVFFKTKKDSLKDNILRKSISETNKTVFAGKLVDLSENNIWGSFETSDTFFINFPQVTIGCSNIVVDNKNVIRSFWAREITQKDTINHFAMEVIRRYKPELIENTKIKVQ